MIIVAFDCPTCGREFDTKTGLGVHRSRSHDPAWRDKEVLDRLYNDEGLPLTEIADRLGCNHNSVKNNMERHGLNRRKSPSDPTHPPYHCFLSGGDFVGAEYEVVQTRIDGRLWHFKVHRLMAVAHGIISPDEFFDPNVVVHHNTEHGLDNRESSLERMTRSEHTGHHSPSDYSSAIG